jgi:hypothetical protein
MVARPRRLRLPRSPLRNHVIDSPAFGILREGFVVEVVGVFGNNVPGVQEAGDVAERAEEEVEQGVEGAETALDPDCRRLVSKRDSVWWVDGGKEGRRLEECGDVPAMGGKRMAMSPRKMSPADMVAVL